MKKAILLLAAVSLLEIGFNIDMGLCIPKTEAAPKKQKSLPYDYQKLIKKGVVFSEDGTILKSVPKTFKGHFDIPNGVIEISTHAFRLCNMLTGISIPYGVTTIEAYTFSNCSQLRIINIPNSVISIGSGAFRGCTKIININIPDGVTYIGKKAFCDCKYLKSIFIPKNCKYSDDSFPDDCQVVIRD